MSLLRCEPINIDIQAIANNPTHYVVDYTKEEVNSDDELDSDEGVDKGDYDSDDDKIKDAKDTMLYYDPHKDENSDDDDDRYEGDDLYEPTTSTINNRSRRQIIQHNDFGDLIENEIKERDKKNKIAEDISKKKAQTCYKKSTLQLVEVLEDIRPQGVSPHGNFQYFHSAY